jgi:hypothetical protein
MKINLCRLFIALTLIVGAYQGTGQIAVFPIATNAGVVNLSTAFATSGSNSLTALLSDTNVCFQLVSSNGTLIGPRTIIGSSQTLPLAAYGGGNYLVYWNDDFIFVGPSEYGQIVSPSGVPVGSPFSIPSTGMGVPKALASDGTNFLAVMEDDARNFYGQIVTAAGALSGPQFPISSQPENGDSAAALFGRTNYLVVWQSNNNSTGNNNKTYGEFVSSAGSAGSPFQINQMNSLDQNPLAIGFDGTNYLVLWNVDTNLTATGKAIWKLYGRLVSQAGTFPGNEFLLNTNPAIFPSLAFDGTNYLLNWSTDPGTNAANGSTLFQFLNRSASPLGPAFSIFQPQQGTNVPLIGSVAFDGSRFVVEASLGQYLLSPGGDFEGFLSAQTYGAFLSASTTPPRLTVSAPPAAGHFSFQVTGTPGIVYAVQVSTNLGSPGWTALVTNSPTNGTFGVTDPGATNANRFYRVMKQ